MSVRRRKIPLIEPEWRNEVPLIEPEWRNVAPLIEPEWETQVLGFGRVMVADLGSTGPAIQTLW